MRARRGMLAGLAALAACGSSSGQATAPAGHPDTGTQPGAGAQSAGKPPCGPSRARTLAMTNRARLYSLSSGVYGCARGHHSLRLGSSGRTVREPRIGPVALAGVDAAYGKSASGVDTVSTLVIVRRLTDGHQLQSQAATSRSVGPESVQSVTSIVVRTDGAVAWIASASSIIHRGAPDIEVDRVDVRGRALLDSGSAVAERSLRLSGSRLSWRRGSSTRTATLR